METNHPRVFISYSWDSKKHQEWVICLANDLRSNGINAFLDQFITQSETVNLNKMMVTNLRDSDCIIFVLTENYAEKANQYKGGVGFETVLTLPFVRENPNKLILIMRHKGDYTKVFPFHLKDVYAIDFSSDENYEEKLEELVYRIFNKPIYEVKPLGPIPDLKPKTITKQFSPPNTISKQSSPSEIDSHLIPRLKRISDKDKMLFIKGAYNQMKSKFLDLFEKTKRLNEEFDYDYEDISSRKAIFHGYVEGKKRVSMKIWHGSSAGLSEGIYLSFDPIVNVDNDNSFNEMIVCEVNNNELHLRQIVNMVGNKDKHDIDSIVQGLWLYYIKNRIE